jgi:hypothetical protein
MAKNLKDLVEEGFSQLDAIGEKRIEILARAEKMGNVALSQKVGDAEAKVRDAESRCLPEMESQVQQLLQELRQTLAHVAEGNVSVQNDLRRKLKLQVSGLLSQIAQRKSYTLSGARGRLDVSLLELETEFRSAKNVLSSEVARLLAELNSMSHNNLSVLRQSQSEVAMKISLAGYDVSESLTKAFNQMTDGVETKRRETVDFLDSLYHRQMERLEEASADLNLRLAPVVSEECDTMKDRCIAGEKALEQVCDTALSTAYDEMKALSHEPLEKLEKQSDRSRQELLEKSAVLQDMSKRFLEEEQSFLTEQSNRIAGKSDKIYAALTKFEMGAESGHVADALAEISVEFSGLVDDLQRRLKDLLGTQSQGLARLNTSVDKAFSDLFVDFKTQLKELVRVQEQICAKKEEELFAHLQKLEKQIDETHSLLRGSGLSGKKETTGAEAAGHE